jgi:hypothetical protein
MVRAVRAEGERRYIALLLLCPSVAIVTLTPLHPATFVFLFASCAAPLRRRPNFVRHEKKWMRRKRMKMERRYLRLQEGVDELKAYIKFKQDNKPDY